MDIFNLTRSKTRKKILELFYSSPGKDFYLHELKRKLFVSAGNIRREIIPLLKVGLFDRYQKGRFVYYKINTDSIFYNVIKAFMDKPSINKDIISEGFLWVSRSSPYAVTQDLYCQTSDVFRTRLETFSLNLEKKIGEDAYLMTAVAGEIGNNSFDHNLGNWPDIPGIYFAYDFDRKIIVLADRGQGVLKTIRNVKPDVDNDSQALKVAFTEIISGRFGEKRGNGLKFVSQVIRDKTWHLQFDSGKAHLEIDNTGKMSINIKKRNIQGCFAVIKY